MTYAPAKKKRILHQFVMKEISPVTKPAMEGAKALITKSDDFVKRTFEEALNELQFREVIYYALCDMWDLNDALRMSISGIIANKAEYPDTMAAIKDSLQSFADAVTAMVEEGLSDTEKSLAKGKKEGGKEFPAGDYAYVPDPASPSTWKLRLTAQPGGNPDPVIVGAAVAAIGKGFRGNLVNIPVEDSGAVRSKVLSAWLKANPGKSSDDLPEVLKTQEETMANERTVEVVEAELAVAKAEASLNDTEKAHYNSLSDAGKASFLKMDKNARSLELNKAADANPVVYTSDKGIVFRKSDDTRMIEMAKENDATSRELKKSREEKETLRLEKAADGEYKTLPGERPAKVALLKAVEGIEDEEVRTQVTSILKAQAESFKPSLVNRGTRGGSAETNSLEKMAKAHQDKHPELTYEQSYDEVLKTPEGQKLYDEASTQE